MQRRLLPVPTMSQNPLNSPIHVTLFNNRDTSRIHSVTKISNDSELRIAKKAIKEWINMEYSTWLNSSKQYTDSVTIHCTKNREYIQLNIVILRYGPLFNIGNVVLSMLHSHGGTYKVINFKFKYEIDKEDREQIILITTQVLDIMSTSNFDVYSDTIHSLFNL